jgi:hypothetical protein
VSSAPTGAERRELGVEAVGQIPFEAVLTDELEPGVHDVEAEVV